jgi:hypothetical protein
MKKTFIALVLFGQMASAATNCQQAYLELSQTSFEAGKYSGIQAILEQHGVSGNFIPAAGPAVQRDIDNAETKFQENLEVLNQKNADFVKNCLK